MKKNPFAIITGAAKGLGFALAKKCLSEKIDVIAVDIDDENLQQAKEQLQELGKINVYCVDVANQREIKNFANEIVTNIGIPHYIFNNAGLSGDMLPIWEQSSEKFQKIMDVNFYSAFYLIKALLPVMIDAKSKGIIVNTASMASFYSAPLISSYVISKHSMMAFSECLYHDLKAINSEIQVAVVCPGGVRTTILDEELELNKLPQAPFNTILQTINKDCMLFMIKFAKLIKKGMDPDIAAYF